MTVTELSPPPVTTTTVGVVIIDRHRLFARGMEAALEDASFGRVSVLGTGDTVPRVCDLIRRHRPRVVIVDLGLPDALTALSTARRRYPSVRFAAMAPEAEATDVAVSALAAGADGVLLRDADPEAVATQLLAIASGGTVAPPAVLASLLRRRPADAVLSQLRRADLELWRMVAEGHETVVIARRLCVSERTAKRMVARLLQRVGVANRVQAAALAGRCGVLDSGRTPDRMETEHP